MALLTVENLHKGYVGKPVLKGVNLGIQPGRVIGLLGPNGSGKTTLLKTLCGLLSPDEGKITYPNGGVWGTQAKACISYLPDQMLYPKWMRVKHAFKFYQDMYPDYSKARAEEMVQLLDLPMDTHISKLSKGMVERVSLGLAFSRQAALYLLDEPLGGIDPVGKAKVLEGIISNQREDASIVISTHLVKDVDTVIDSIVLLDNGAVLMEGDCETIRSEQGKTVEQVYLEVFANVKAV